jgi:hypothetical protein
MLFDISINPVREYWRYQIININEVSRQIALSNGIKKPPEYGGCFFIRALIIGVLVFGVGPANASL